MKNRIFKIVRAEEWQQARDAGTYHGAPVDRADGFIHFSTADQVEETAAKHFAGQTDLLLVAVDPEALGADLRFEPSRGGALFPHLYAALSMTAVISEKPLPLKDNGMHNFEGLI